MNIFKKITPEEIKIYADTSRAYKQDVPWFYSYNKYKHLDILKRYDPTEENVLASVIIYITLLLLLSFTINKLVPRDNIIKNDNIQEIVIIVVSILLSFMITYIYAFNFHKFRKIVFEGVSLPSKIKIFSLFIPILCVIILFPSLLSIEKEELAYGFYTFGIIFFICWLFTLKISQPVVYLIAGVITIFFLGIPLQEKKSKNERSKNFSLLFYGIGAGMFIYSIFVDSGMVIDYSSKGIWKIMKCRKKHLI